MGRLFNVGAAVALQAVIGRLRLTGRLLARELQCVGGVVEVRLLLLTATSCHLLHIQAAQLRRFRPKIIE